MRALRKSLAAVALTTAALLAGAPGLVGTAQAATTLVYTEKTTKVTFIPALDNPDPRGAGSVLITEGDLYQGSVKVGTAYVTCVTTRKVGNDYFGNCDETLRVPGGALFARGEINESALERFVPQSIPIRSGGGIYGGKTGTLTIQQVVFPDQFTLTARLN